MNKDQLLTQQLIGYGIYTTAGLIYCFVDGGDSMFLLVIFFSIFVFIYNLLFTFLGSLLFKKWLLIHLLTPQIVGLTLFIYLKLSAKNTTTSDTDKLIGGYLILSTIFNVYTYFKYRGNQSSTSPIHVNKGKNPNG
jgi:hypothetical protein